MRPVGGLFQDSLGTFLGAFSCNIGINLVFHSEVLTFVFAMEHDALRRW